MCVVGNGIFKLYRYSEGTIKQFAFQKLEAQNYLSQAWVSEERVLVGTDHGRLLLFESGELKTEFNLATLDDSRERYNTIAIIISFIFIIIITVLSLCFRAQHG